MNLEERLNELKANIISRHVDAGQVASGRTKAGFEVKMLSPYHGQLLGYSYSGVLERGRKPGRIPKEFRAIIERWAVAKGISFNSDADRSRFAYFVAQKIQREGTKLFRSGGTVDVFSSALVSFTDLLATEALDAFEIEVKNQIFIR
jgi:hypothetical protein